MSLGIILSLCANTGMNLGTNVIKLAHNKRMRQYVEMREAIEAELEAQRQWKAGEKARKKALRRGAKKGGAGGMLTPVGELAPAKEEQPEPVFRPAKEGEEDPAMRKPPGEGSPEKVLTTSETFLRPAGSAGKHLRTGSGGRGLGKRKKRRVKRRRAQLKPIYKSKTWIAGFALFKISNWTNFAAYGFGSQSVLSALASVQFVSNLVFGGAFLGERPTGRMVLGTLLIVCGILFVILFSNTSSNQDYVMQDLLELYRSPVYIVYITLLSMIGAGAYYAYRKLQREGERLGPGGIKLPEPIAKPLCFSLYSAIIGTQSVTFSKMFVELIRSNFSPDYPPQAGYFLTWVFLVGLIVCGIFWDKQLNAGLREFDALVIVPMMQAFWTMLTIINGGVYFQEFQQMSPKGAAMFVVGVVVVLAGMMSVVPQAKADIDYLLQQPGQGWDQQSGEIGGLEAAGEAPAAAAGSVSPARARWNKVSTATKFIGALQAARGEEGRGAGGGGASSTSITGRPHSKTRFCLGSRINRRQQRSVWRSHRPEGLASGALWPIPSASSSRRASLGARLLQGTRP